VFTAIWNGIKSFFQAVWNFLVNIVKTYGAVWHAVFKAVGDFFKAIWDAIVSFFQGVWDGIVATVSAAGEFLKGVFTAVGDFFTGIWNGIVSFFQGIWDGLTNIVNTFVEVFKGAFTAVSDFFTGIWNGITTFFTGVWDGIKNTVSGVKDFFKNVFDAIANIVKAPINFIIDGINAFIGMLNNIKIPDWVPGVGGKGINLPTIPKLAKGGVLKKGQMGLLEGDGAEAVVPLEKNTQWIKKVADMFKANITADVSGVVAAVKGIGGIVGGAVKSIGQVIERGKEQANNSGLTDALRSFGEDVVTLAKGAVASPSTVQSMVSNTTNRSVTQNNHFENTFHGDRAGQKRSSEAMNKSANDVTGELARALAYQR
jgi:phage-related protein